MSRARSRPARRAAGSWESANNAARPRCCPVRVQGGDRGQLVGGPQQWVHLVRDRGIEPGMGGPGGIGLVPLGQPLDAVLPDRLQHPVPRRVGPSITVSSDLSTSASSRSAMSSAGSRSSAHTAPALVRVAPAGKTASRSASSRSSARSRSQLHSTTARSVRCRGSAVRLPPVSSRNRSDSRVGDLADRHHPQARRRQLDRQRQAVEPADDLDDGVDVVDRRTTNPGATAARPLDQQAHGRVVGRIRGPTRRRRAGPAAAPGTAPRRRCPAVPDWWRAPADPGSRRAVASTSSATGSIRCSQLSITSRQSASASTSNRYSVLSRAVRSARRSTARVSSRPRAPIIAGTIPFGSVTGPARSATRRPGGRWRRWSRLPGPAASSRRHPVPRSSPAVRRPAAR